MAQTALRRGSQEEGNSDYFTGCPIGGGFMWFGLPDKIPSNCMICDNSTLAIANFAKLHENLGGAWGVSGANLNIPDLRGRFPRGVDGSAGNDPDKAARTAANAGGNTGNAVGSVQDDQTKSHRHLTNDVANSNKYGEVGGQPSSPIVESGYYGSSTVGEYTTYEGGNESRPKNANVYFVIRVS